tara:strand:- start:18 stop:416 length:399 start_codon:yes stop_codon:yes gene_type:complete
MNKIYCQNCGKANEYRSLPTKFCGKCGNDMSKLLTDDSDTVNSPVATRPSTRNPSSEPASQPFQRRRKDRGKKVSGELDNSYDSDVEEIDIDSLDLGGVTAVNSDDIRSESSAFSLNIGIPTQESTETPKES